MSYGLSRRDFLRLTGGGAAGVATGLYLNPAFLAAQGAQTVDSPLSTAYPNRDWEAVYRNIATEDSKFAFTCAPNDTHNCILWAYLKNGVVTRIGPTYGYGKATDLDGNQASSRWDPRACQKGLAMARKFYGDRRVRSPRIRKGFLDWAEADFPRDAKTGEPDMDRIKRGEDTWVEVEWEKAFDVAARALVNIAETYSGKEGAAYLRAQGYDPAMIETEHYGGAGTRTMKFRGGMPLLGVTRIVGFYRFANMLALLDAKIRGVGPEDAKAARPWDSYTWHTDLPPGHPMVTGHQTVEFELFAPEQADLVITFGMNWIVSKMPDSHWLTEARLKGTKVISISTDYQSTSHKADEVIVIRPATDAALALGAAKVIIDEKLYDAAYVKRATDLPLLVRMDSLQMLKASDAFPEYVSAPLVQAEVFESDEHGKPIAPLPPNFKQDTQYIPDTLREEWGDFVVWDTVSGKLVAVTRDQVGQHFEALGVDPALGGEHTITLANGKDVKVRSVFSLVKQYLDDNCDLDTISEVTWAPKAAIRSLARQVAGARQRTLMACGMGPNHYFNADLKDRAIFLLAALTDNVGHIGGNVGSYAGNYRLSVFNGVPLYAAEDPFDIELDPTRPSRKHDYYVAESAHYYNYGDRPLRAGKHLKTGSTHMPTPTKSVWFGNSNSLLGNAKWHYDVVHNTLPKIEAIFVNEWWWTASCEYADIVFGVDSWAEFQLPDMVGSCTNPFLVVWPKTGLPKRIFDTRSDTQVHAGVAARMAELVDEPAMRDYWKFIHDGTPEVYLQRILDASSSTRGYQFADLHDRARQGVPALMNFRTYPRQGGWEQRYESKPWYTKSGRLEFYRDEPEFREYGENLPVWRETVDSTFHEPNVILSAGHPAIKPKTPRAYGIEDDRSSEARQMRHVTMPWSELKKTKHPLNEKDDEYRFIFISPKYRHGAHTTPIDLDWIAVYFGPFGDIYRHDDRKPWVGEGYVEINPKDAKDIGVEDGDYVWIDGDPEDRPYRGWKKDDEFYDVARCMARARYNNAMPHGVTRMWFHMYVATKGSVRGQKERDDNLAKNPDTNYQSFFRHGSHQAGTRAWLRPTLLTDSLVRKPNFGHVIGKGFEPDVHCANGAPKESFVRIRKAEPGGYGGDDLWLPARQGLRPTYESEDMKRYLRGGFVDLNA